MDRIKEQKIILYILFIHVNKLYIHVNKFLKNIVIQLS